MGVGRGMGMAIMQRDDDPNDPVKLREVSKYASESVAEDLAEVNRLASLTLDQAEYDAQIEFAELSAKHDEAVKVQDSLRRRYKNMMADVEEWAPVTESGQATKRVALQYLRESYDWDCRDGRDVYPSKPRAADFTAAVWLSRKKSEAARSLAFSQKQLSEELERVKEFNESIVGFYQDLPS